VEIEQRALPRAHPGGGSVIQAKGLDEARGRLPPTEIKNY